ncbi:hypothetical protein K466DRAFT_77242 [Polyporus arcularius HHB13444]|uniref:Uncharacterized protein n=1 Tax=Polyporus arcularius HHB13444 TaxID=1314778 RepID=A0A5C3NML4_9APHY|nr:hypothetical protein K466DRAFT_77242 [Polyporus arcularius HHB13444]
MRRPQASTRVHGDDNHTCTSSTARPLPGDARVHFRPHSRTSHDDQTRDHCFHGDQSAAGRPERRDHRHHGAPHLRSGHRVNSIRDPLQPVQTRCRGLAGVRRSAAGAVEGVRRVLPRWEDISGLLSNRVLGFSRKAPKSMLLAYLRNDAALSICAIGTFAFLSHLNQMEEPQENDVDPFEVEAMDLIPLPRGGMPFDEVYPLWIGMLRTVALKHPGAQA